MFVADREVQRILLELLNQMDGFDQNVNVKVRKNILVIIIFLFKHIFIGKKTWKIMWNNTLLNVGGK